MIKIVLKAFILIELENVHPWKLFNHRGIMKLRIKDHCNKTKGSFGFFIFFLWIQTSNSAAAHCCLPISRSAQQPMVKWINLTELHETTFCANLRQGLHFPLVHSKTLKCHPLQCYLLWMLPTKYEVHINVRWYDVGYSLTFPILP